MKKSLYCVRDMVANSIGPICVFENDEVAKRSFIDIVKSGKDSIMSRCPADFVMIHIGDIDVGTGDIVPTMNLVISALEVLEHGND